MGDSSVVSVFAEPEPILKAATTGEESVDIVCDLVHLAMEAATREISIFVMSTSQQLLDEIELDRPEHGTYRYLAKPFNLDDLLQAVDELIGPT